MVAKEGFEEGVSVFLFVSFELKTNLAVQIWTFQRLSVVVVVVFCIPDTRELGCSNFYRTSYKGKDKGAFCD